jgi:Ca-activated chloride channel homolog
MTTFRFPLFFLIAVLLCACLNAGAQENSQEPSRTIRISVDRVNVGVIVTDGRGQFVEDLRREDFQIFDNGVEQPLTGFATYEEPAQVLLLIESGPAVRLLGGNHLHAADRLLNNLGSGDRVAIASYSRDPELLFDFTTNKAATRMALDDLNFANGFAELNLSSSLALAIDWLTTLPGKKTIVVLSTGLDTSPAEKSEMIERKLKTSDVRILAVSVTGDFRKPVKHRKLSPQEVADRAEVKKGFAQADQALHELSEATGGRVYFPTNEKEFDRAYAEIAQLVRHEYSLAFDPPAHDSQVHSITVKVKGFRRRVDHRQAYFAPAPM